MASNLEITDIYTNNSDPNASVNPKLKGCMWINNVSGEAWTCIDNTLNKNKWVRFYMPDKWKDLGTLRGSVNITINGANNDYNNFYMILSGSTTLNQVIYTNAAERSGVLCIINGGKNLAKFFNNVYYSFTVPISSPPNNSNNGNLLYFPYKVMPNGIGGSKMIFTRV